MTTLDIDIRLNRGSFSLQIGLCMATPGITALIGPSGCGKSTLLRAIAGLEYPRQGHIRMNDNVWFDSRRSVCLSPQQRRTGFMFQHYALFPHMSVWDNICFGAPNGAVDQVLELAEKLQIADILDCRPDRISGGQRQRVALARALAMAPDLLLLDEPFSSVDALLRGKLRRLLRRTVSETGIPALIVTHDLDDVREVADWVGVMGTGCLLRFGAVDEIVAASRDAGIWYPLWDAENHGSIVKQRTRNRQLV